MDTTAELHQEFSKLPTLNHVGIALLQFAVELNNSPTVRKDVFGIYGLGIVGFSFPKGGEEKIKMHVKLDLKKVNAMDLRWLPLSKHQESDFYECEITGPSQLGQAVRYIEYTRNKYLTTRQIPSDTEASN